MLGRQGLGLPCDFLRCRLGTGTLPLSCCGWASASCGQSSICTGHATQEWACACGQLALPGEQGYLETGSRAGD